MITAIQLKKIWNWDDNKAAALATALNDTFEKFEINTPLRQCHFLAQVMHESGCFKYDRELWGPTDVQKRYEGRKDLGNVHPGDGFKFRGRGWIQMTGRSNYEQFSEAVGTDFAQNPDMLARMPWVALAAGWFWDTRKLNQWADKDDVLTITKRINGGTNGLDDRKKWLLKCKEVIK